MDRLLAHNLSCCLPDRGMTVYDTNSLVVVTVVVVVVVVAVVSFSFHVRRFPRKSEIYHGIVRLHIFFLSKIAIAQLEKVLHTKNNQHRRS
jgi:hypothetical protein